MRANTQPLPQFHEDLAHAPNIGAIVPVLRQIDRTIGLPDGFTIGLLAQALVQRFSRR
jgi:hypothetical protein